MDLTNLDWTHWSCCSNEDMKNKFLELQSQVNNCESCGICLAPTELTATTTTTQSPAPPQCRNFWNDQFCTFLKVISRTELNDNHCLTTDRSRSWNDCFHQSTLFHEMLSRKEKQMSKFNKTNFMGQTIQIKTCFESF